MSRNLASAGGTGARFEQQVADYHAAHVDDRIEYHSNAMPADQWIQMRLADLVALLTGDRPNNESETP